MSAESQEKGKRESSPLNFKAPGLTDEERQERLKTAFDKYFFFGTREKMLRETGRWDLDGFRDFGQPRCLPIPPGISASEMLESALNRLKARFDENRKRCET